MTLEQLPDVGEALGGIAVIIALLCLFQGKFGTEKVTSINLPMVLWTL